MVPFDTCGLRDRSVVVHGDQRTHGCGNRICRYRIDRIECNLLLNVHQRNGEIMDIVGRFNIRIAVVISAIGLLAGMIWGAQ